MGDGYVPAGGRLRREGSGAKGAEEKSHLQEGDSPQVTQEGEGGSPGLAPLGMFLGDTHIGH